MRTCVKRSHTDILKEGGERETRDRVQRGERERKTTAYNVEREKDTRVQRG